MLKRQCGEGLTLYIAPDIEFFYFTPPQPGERPTPLDFGGYDLTTRDVTGDLRKQTIRPQQMGSRLSTHSMKIPPANRKLSSSRRCSHHCRLGDDIPSRRARGCGTRCIRNVYAQAAQGAGLVHLPVLFTGDENAFYDEADEYNLSPCKIIYGRFPQHAAEITAITNPTVNSYKRLVPGFEAPVHLSWARNNRSGLIRVPIPKRGQSPATRLEYRSPDPSCNPTLPSASCLPPDSRCERVTSFQPRLDANLFELDDGGARQTGNWPTAPVTF